MRQPLSTRGFMLACLLFVPGTSIAAEVNPLLGTLIGEPVREAVMPAPLRSQGQPALLSEGDPIGVWIHARDNGLSLESKGLLSRGRPTYVRHARWTREQIHEAILDPNVEALSPARRCALYMDSSLVETFTSNTHNATGNPPVYAGLTGEGILVGIIDTGIDLHHPDFLDATGHTRILSLWDQQDPGGVPPPGFFYGAEWSSSQIDAGIATEVDGDTGYGHGTHVAGIAAGDGSATGNGQAGFRYVGVAPNALIVVVKTDLLETSIVDGVQYIFGQADNLGIPAVVNLSLGTQAGPHDGTYDLDVALSALTGMGKVIVAASGNETSYGLHAERTVTAPDTASVSFEVSDYTPESGIQNDWIEFDGWYTGGTNLSITILTPDGDPIGPVPKGSYLPTGQQETPAGHVEIYNATGNPPNGDHNLAILIYDKLSGNPPDAGMWRILIEAVATGPVTSASQFDIWNDYTSFHMTTEFSYGRSESKLVSSPGTADSVIAVGAYITKRSWTALDGLRHGYAGNYILGDIAYFSSVGPRRARTDLMKPEVSAPGMGIAAARASNATAHDARTILQDGVHVILQGTSMSAPHVTGLAALIFQAMGPKYVREVRELLTSTARSDSITGPVPNPTFGYGRIDALRATGYVVPATLVSATAVQDGDRVLVHFVLAEDAGTIPLPVFREGPDSGDRSRIGWSTAGSERAYVDSTLSIDGTYRYWLRADEAGGAVWLGPAVIAFARPRVLSLDAAPNPALGPVRIRWFVPPPARASLTIHDLTGRRIRSFDPISPQGMTGAGVVSWDATDDRGRPVARGIYMIRLRTTDGREITRKLTRVE